MTVRTETPRQPKVGDRLVNMASHFGGWLVYSTQTVEKITPTGIMVLSNGKRLNPKPEFGGWVERGKQYRDRWYHVDSPQHRGAMATEERKRAERDVTNAYDEWKKAARAGWTKDALKLAATLKVAIEEYETVVESIQRLDG